MHDSRHELNGEFRGLTSTEVSQRRAQDGLNELPASEARGLLVDVLELLREPMSLLLLVCGAIYAAVGDRQEALMLLSFAIFIMGLTLFQERKTSRALAALRDLASPRALVIRDGERVRIAGRELVQDDLIVLAEGDRVPADAVVLKASDLAVDESLVSGESVPVRKTVWDGELAFARPGGEDLPFLYAGTLLVAGTGISRVRAIGAHTEIGRIGAALQTKAKAPETPLQIEARGLVVKLAWVSGALSLIAAVGYGVAAHDALGGLLAGLTLAMAILPNEFPVVVAMFLALGAWRLSKRKVLARHIPAVESLGSVTVLCVDKTGTLTENRMTVSRLTANGETFDVQAPASEELPESMHRTVEYAILASRRDPFDPMERAFKALGEGQLAGTEHLHDDWQLIREYPLTRERLAVIRVWRDPRRSELEVSGKGAPETIARLCALDAPKRAELEENVRALASGGLRVLAVARARVADSAIPDEPSALPFEFVGLVGLEDPLRSGISTAVAECHSAGIRVIMITGDYPSTAQAIASQAGIPAARVVTGPELNALSDRELRQRVADTSVFARMLPEQKLILVRALASNGELVAMTGDGVNDAPALKAAHVGIAMGGRGTDVAREAAAVVLLEDDFAALVDGIRTGRRVVDNLTKALSYILAVHLPIVGLTLVPIAMGWPLVMLPIHIAFLHLVIDPACSIVFEAQPEEPGVMQRPPRAPQAPMFGQRVIGISMAQGVAVSIVVLAVDALALHLGRAEAEARTLTFATFLTANLGLIFTNRSWSRTIAASSLKDRMLWIVTGGALLFSALVVFVPALARLFRFASLSLVDLVFCVAAGALSVTWFEIVKHRMKPPGSTGTSGDAPTSGSAIRTAA
ncbi:MAG TPA: cation-translocating P-type ATPase [Polyangiaceae bacterium]|nr:cation-translocating P-type ATPase [Polyangiaceae bacterium]